MKKLLLIFLILFPLTAYSASITMIGGSGTITEGASSENVGFESAGGTGHTFADDYMYCTRLTDTPSTNGTVESITVTSGCAGEGATGAIYLSLYTNGSGKPDDLVTNSNVGPLETVYNSNTPYDITHTYTGTKPTVTSGATYWVCINNDGATVNSRGLVTDGSGTCSGTGQCSVTEANAHDNFPSNWDSITPDFSDDGRMRGKAFITISY